MPIATQTELYDYSLARLFNCMSDITQFEPTFEWVSNRWADIADKLMANVIPLSVTAPQARAAFITALAPLPTLAVGGNLVLDQAFTAYAATLALGMLPLWTGVPPPSPCTIPIGLPLPTSNPYALIMSTYLTSWAKTGTATLVAPPYTVVNWI